jgi:sugar/nucleoside kinase (ribokinase family)
MNGQKLIGLMGTMTYDVIASDTGEVYRGLGGILYQAAVLSALEKNVLLFTNLGEELVSHFERATRHWRTLQSEGIKRVPGPGNRVYLHYPEDGERREILESVVPSIDPRGVLPSLGRLEALVSVLNSGFDITLPDWRRIVDAAECPTWLDIHSLVLSRELKAPRKLHSQIPWESWARGVTYLQANRTELCCLLGRVGQELSGKEIALFGQRAFDLGLRAVFVTMGGDGVWVLTPDRARILRPSRPQAVKDTTGCGDVFCAATVRGLAEGVDLFAASQVGVELATQATTAQGVEETFALVRRAMAKLEYP